MGFLWFADLDLILTRALCLLIRLSLLPSLLPGKAGRSAQTGHEAVLEQLIVTAKTNKPADEAVPVAILHIIYDRHRYILSQDRMPAHLTVGTA